MTKVKNKVGNEIYKEIEFKMFYVLTNIEGTYAIVENIWIKNLLINKLASLLFKGIKNEKSNKNWTPSKPIIVI